MKLQRTITTTTTPMIKSLTIQTVTGKVWYVNPPNSVILTLEDNTKPAIQDPQGSEIQRRRPNGRRLCLEEGMKVSATKVVRVPAADRIPAPECDWHDASCRPQRPLRLRRRSRQSHSMCLSTIPSLPGTRCSLCSLPRSAHSTPAETPAAPAESTSQKKPELPSLGRFGRASKFSNRVRGSPRRRLEVRQVKMVRVSNGFPLTYFPAPLGRLVPESLGYRFCIVSRTAQSLSS